MKTYRAIKTQGNNRPVVAVSSSRAALSIWVRENKGQHITAKEYDYLRRQWAKSGGMPNVVVEV